MNNFPNNWTKFNLIDICFFQEGPGLRNFQYKKKGTKFINIRCIKDGYLDTSISQYLSSEEVEETYKHFLLDEGDYVLSSSGTIGRIAVVRKYDLPLLLNTSVIRFRTADKSKLNNKYLFYFLQSKQFFEKIFEQSQGSAQVNFGPTHLKLLNAYFPPILEQKKIAEILICFDKYINLLKLKIQKLQNLFIAQRQELLKNKVNWVEYKICKIADPLTKYSLTGGPFGSDLKASEYTQSGIRIIQLQNIGDGTFKDKNKIYTSIEKANSLISSNIFSGDLIIAKMGDPVAKCTFIPKYLSRCLMSSDGIRLKVNKIKFNDYFIQININSPYFRKKILRTTTGTTRQRIGLKDFRELTIPCPSLKEQERISYILKSIEDSIRNLKKKVNLVEDLRKGLLSCLLLGKKTVKI